MGNPRGCRSLVWAGSAQRHTAGPQLAGALSSLSFSFELGEKLLFRMLAAQEIVLAVSARLQHLELGLGAARYYTYYSAIDVSVSDAAFEDLLRSLPCCQSLRLSCCGAVSDQTIGRELPRAVPDLLSLTLSTGYLDEEVSTTAQRSLHCPHVARHLVGCRLLLHHRRLLAAALCFDI